MTGSQDEITTLLESARRVGLEIDEDEARHWLAAMAAGDDHTSLTFDARTGVFGHRIAMLDFSDADLAHFRRVGALVEIPDEDGVETALALSGSAAQSKIQTYPGDCDFFERVNIRAPSREEACRAAGRVVLRKALDTIEGPSYRLMEVKFGSYPAGVVVGGVPMRPGSPISWSPDEIRAGRIEAATPDGASRVISWDDAATDPGWCKLDWVVADAERGTVVNASNMLDITWEAPDGTITPLDGFLDPYFQEVYLDASAIPLFSRLAGHVSADALDEYVEQLESEVRKYIAADEPNFGKAAKRLYNIFRLSGRHGEAAFIREIFDEPATVLYQVHALLRTVEEAARPGSPFTPATVDAQLDRVIIDVIRTLEGAEEEEIVSQLLALKSALASEDRVEEREVRVEAARTRIIALVNTFFTEKLQAHPQVRGYLEEIGGRR